MDRNSITSIGVVAGAVYKSVIGVACYSFLVFSFFLFSFFHDHNSQRIPAVV